MELTSPKIIKELMLRYQAQPSKIMGQNFLIHPPTLANIIEMAELASNDTVLEIGPGIGTLTQELAKKAKRVICIEKDHDMIEILKETLKGLDNIEIIQGNALSDNYSLPITNYKLVANIPYYITSPIIRKFLEAENQPDFMVLMVQKEVAQRICAKAPDMSLLAVSVQFYATAKIISSVSKKHFWPSPKVDSAIIKITPHANKPSVAPDAFFKVVKAGFLHPRKQLANNLSEGLKKEKAQIQAWLLKNNLSPLQRAETLAIFDWELLTSTLDMIN